MKKILLTLLSVLILCGLANALTQYNNYEPTFNAINFHTEQINCATASIDGSTLFVKTDYCSTLVPEAKIYPSNVQTGMSTNYFNVTISYEPNAYQSSMYCFVGLDTLEYTGSNTTGWKLDVKLLPDLTGTVQSDTYSCTTSNGTAVYVANAINYLRFIRNGPGTGVNVYAKNNNSNIFKFVGSCTNFADDSFMAEDLHCYGGVNHDNMGQTYVRKIVGLSQDATTTTTTTTLSTTTSTLFDQPIWIATGSAPWYVVKGSTFKVFTGAFSGSNFFKADKCWVTLDPITQGFGTSFAYDSAGNDISTIHYFPIYLLNPNDWWNYESNLLTVNSTVANGVYNYTAYCNNSRGTVAMDYGGVTVVSPVHTSINIQTATPNNPIQYSFYDWNTYFFDSIGNMLTGANCTLNKTQMEERFGYYTRNIQFPDTGLVNINVSCNKTGWDVSYYTEQFNVLPFTCGNDRQDSGESGIDCGGQCLPCSSNTTTTTLPPVTTTLQTCKNVGITCGVNSDCCNGLYCNVQSYTCQINNPVGQTCINNNDCPPYDGSSYCNQTNICLNNNCTSNANCYPLSWRDPSSGTYSQRPTYCGSDLLCHFASDNQSSSNSQTILPLSGLSSNQSNTIIYVGNCEDQTNGLKVTTTANMQTYYQYGNSPFSPALSASNAKSDGQTGTDKTVLFSELCKPNEDGFGGFPANRSILYAKINVWSCAGLVCTPSQLIDFVNYRQNLKSASTVKLIPSASQYRLFQANSSERSIKVYVRNLPAESWVNVSSVFSNPVNWDQTLFMDKSRMMDTFYYRINTTYGEVYEGRYGSPVWMFIDWDPNTNWFKLNFTIEPWMIWITFAIILIGLAYANYRNRPREV